MNPKSKHAPPGTPEQSLRRTFDMKEILAEVDQRAARSSSLLAKPFGEIPNRDGNTLPLPRYLFIGPRGGDDPIRIGIFAGIHGDQPETIHAILSLLGLLDENPEIARDYFLFIYPICNPTGFQKRTRHSARQRDLNREFWNNSTEPEVLLLESELCAHAFDGIITLHGDSSSAGIYGMVKNGVPGKHLLEGALNEAELYIPRNAHTVIDQFPAQGGIIRGGFAGALSGPPRVRPRPFGIAICLPQTAPLYAQEKAAEAAIFRILVEHRHTMAFARNL
jgi:hypothetical protein